MAILMILGTVEEFKQNLCIDSSTGCHNWIRHTESTGYGQVSWQGRNIQAHRYLFGLLFGKVADDKCVCHHCDNRLCCNPEHLFLGSWQDNMTDMKKKKRSPVNRNERNPNRKLSVEQVAQIREIGHNVPYSHTAKQFGVTPEMISYIVRNKHWSIE